MNQVATLQPQQVSTFGLTPSNLQEAMELAKLMSNSDLVPKDYKRNPGNCLIAMQMGAEIGLPPMQALQNIAVINGRPAVWGDAALAVIQSKRDFVNISEDIDEKTMTAVCTITRKGREPVTRDFSKKDAEMAGLWSKQGPWKQYPKRMLQMRARGFAIRDSYADALKGLCIAEDIQDVKDMGDAEVVTEKSAASVLSKKLASPQPEAEAEAATAELPPNQGLIDELKQSFDNADNPEAFSMVKAAVKSHLEAADLNQSQYEEIIKYGTTLYVERFNNKSEKT